jgi:hypothetical protein
MPQTIDTSSVLDSQGLKDLLEQVQARLGQPKTLSVSELGQLWDQAHEALDQGHYEQALPLWEQLVQAQPGERLLPQMRPQRGGQPRSPHERMQG